MNQINILRREEQIKNLIASIISNEVNNTADYQPTVIDVKLSGDLSHVKVFVSFLNNPKKGLEALKKAAGFIRSRLSKNLDWRKVPELHFFLDEVINHGLEINKIIDNFKNEETSSLNKTNETIETLDYAKITSFETKNWPLIKLLDIKDDTPFFSLKDNQNSKALFVVKSGKNAYGHFNYNNYQIDKLDKKDNKFNLEKLTRKNRLYLRKFIELDSNIIYNICPENDEVILLEIADEKLQTIEINNLKDFNKHYQEKTSTAMNKYRNNNYIKARFNNYNLTYYFDNKNLISFKSKSLVFDLMTYSLYELEKDKKISLRNFLVLNKVEAQ